MGWLAARAFYGDKPLNKFEKDDASFVMVASPYLCYIVILLLAGLIISILEAGVLNVILAFLLSIGAICFLFVIIVLVRKCVSKNVDKILNFNTPDE
ncbi:MAG: hypothetical protein ACOCUT_00185 [bacterium]